MKRIACIAFVVLLCFGLAACSLGNSEEDKIVSTEYDNKEVLRIETLFSPGESTMDYYPTRTFDFENGTVTDERVSFRSLEFMLEEYDAHPEYYPLYATAEEYEAYLQSYYNSPAQVSSFSSEDANALMEEIISFGFYNWKEYYEEDDVSCGGGWLVKITFADGSVKQSGFYLKHPRKHKALKNYEKVESAFLHYFGVEMFMTF